MLNSKKDLSVDSSFTVKVGSMKKTQGGGGGGPLHITNTDTTSTECSIKKKRSMVYITPNPREYLCCARAIVVCMLKLECSTQEFKKLSRAGGTMRGVHKRAVQLHTDARVPMDRRVTVRELYLFERVLDAQIVVVAGDLMNEISYSGSHTRDKKIYLYLKDEHYHSIVNINKFLPNKSMCERCVQWIPRDTGRGKRRHNCGAYCYVCNRLDCAQDDDSEPITCKDCNCDCRSRECYDAHKSERLYKIGPLKGEVRAPALCENYKKCLECGVIVEVTKRPFSKHRCGEWFCRLCREHVTGEHLCYYRIKKQKLTTGKFVFYDFETSQDTLISCEKGFVPARPQGCDSCEPDTLCPRCRRCVNCNKPYCGLKRHVPNFLIAQTACDRCQNHNFTPDSSCKYCGDTCEACFKYYSTVDDKKGVSPPSCNLPQCGKREKCFKGLETTAHFCSWLFNQQHRGFIAIAHNAKGYDAHFILAHCVENAIMPSALIYQGSKIMYMRISHKIDVTFIDSLNFLPMPLKALPKALGLANNVKKGDFPHYFNINGNFNYIGPIPDRQFYGIDQMRNTDREEFVEWYEKNTGIVFDFQAEILEYTRTDVNILREACMKFRGLIKEATLVQGVEGGDRYVDVFAHATLASAAMHIVRYSTMSETHNVTLKSAPGQSITAVLKAGVWTANRTGVKIPESDIATSRFVKSQIPQIPAAGYVKSSKHSVKSLAWLEWLSLKQLGGPRRIRHARNGGEFRIKGTRYFADGQHGNTLYEFYGCYYHGHHCVPDRQVKDPKSRRTMATLYQECQRREAQIKALGYQLITIWECQWDREVSQSQELQRFVAALDLPPPLKIRDALTGGRTCPIKLFHECGEGEVIRYVDVTSMYPTANLHMRVPTCHPVIITDPALMDHTLKSYFGVIKAKVLPPTNLYIPVLPYRANSRLLFPLCRTCCEESRPDAPECVCTDEERALIGTWCSDELLKAIELGYRIIKIYEIYHYPETTKFDPDTGEGGLFKEYVQTFLKLKQEASGYPAHCKTESDRLEYIRSYAERQGISLDKERIEFNPGLRLVAKLFLNSCWGKFCERPNRAKVVFVKTALDLAKMMNDVSKEVMDFHIISDDVIAVEMKDNEDFSPESLYTNELIGALTTSYGRLQLLDIIRKVGEDVLYFDTDSVVFAMRENEWDTPYGPLQTGDLLGELTDELGGPDTYIKLFASSGPKCYTYVTNKDESTLKLKGITMNYKNSQVINVEAVKKVIFGEISHIVTPQATQITRQKFTGLIYNRPHKKTYSKIFTKRRILEGTFNTVPYGFRM
jgi:hypothetical protein